MNFHEEVYTSAPQLLEGGGSHLGVVARTRRFPRAIEPSLAFQRAYTMLPQLPVDRPEQHPPRIIVSTLQGDRPYFCISHVVYAGADHTGRNSPLAHHLAFDTEQMALKELSPAAVLARLPALVYTRWNQPPRWIDPQRSTSFEPFPPDDFKLPSDVWNALMDPTAAVAVLAAIADALVGFASTRKSVVVCIPIEAAVHTGALIADILSVLPSSIQNGLICASHVVEEGDYVDKAALLITYPYARFLARAVARQDARAPFIFDLSRRECAMETKQGSFGHAIRRYLGKADSGKMVRNIARMFQELDLGSEDADRVEPALKLYREIHQMRSLTALNDVAAMIGIFNPSSPHAATCVARWCDEGCKRLYQLLKGSLDGDAWAARAFVATDARWPAGARQRAAQAIANDYSQALPIVFRHKESRGKVDSLCATLVAEHPEIVEQWVTHSVSAPASANMLRLDRDILGALIRASRRTSYQSTMGWVRAALNGNAPASSEVLEDLVAHSSHLLDSPQQARGFHSEIMIDNSDAKRVRSEFYTPLLHRALSNGRDARTSGDLSRRLIEVALRDDLLVEELNWLRRNRADIITEKSLNEWRRSARESRAEQAFQRGVYEAGIEQPMRRRDATRIRSLPFGIYETDIGRTQRHRHTHFAGITSMTRYLVVINAVLLCLNSADYIRLVSQFLGGESAPSVLKRILPAVGFQPELFRCARMLTILWLVVWISTGAFFRFKRFSSDKLKLIFGIRLVTMLLLLAAAIVGAFRLFKHVLVS